MKFLAALTALIVVMANGVATEMSLMTGISAENLHLIIRILSILLIAILIFNGNINTNRVKYAFPIILFYALYVLSSLRHQLFTGLGDVEPERFWFVVGPGIFSAILFAMALKKSEIADMNNYLNGFFLALNAPSLFIIMASGVGNIRTYTIYETSMGSSLIWGQLGTYAIAVSLPAMLGHKPSVRSVAIAASSAIVGAGLVYLSFSRGALLAAATVIAIALLGPTSHLSRKEKKRILWLKLFVLAIIFVGAIYFFGSENADRLFGTTERLGDNKEARIDIWLDAIYLAGDNLLGYGIQTPGHNHPHNLFIEALLNAGILGILLAFSAFALAFFTSLLNIRRRGATWVDLLFLAAFQTSLVSSALYLNIAIWFLTALVLSLRGDPEKGQGPDPSRAYERSLASQA